MLLQGKKIILAITGSIAAYKTPQLVRLLVKEGALVQVIMTEAATQFVTPLSLSTVSKNKVYTHVSDGEQWNNHVALGRWADVMLIAPCSANTLAKLATGICDNIVQAVYLSCIAPVMIAPAMDEDMWHHPSTKNNLEQIQKYGNTFIPVAHGELASGLIGAGRMAEPEEIVQHLINFLSPQPSTKRKKALVTAGPTYEMIDPVRFIGNFSTGKMGIAIAEALANKGYEVSLILGPSALQTQHPNIKTTKVVSAEEMYKACLAIFPKTEIAIMTAAVADFKPSKQASQKIKKGNATQMDLILKPTQDILASLGKIKKQKQTLVGFALETQNGIENASKKLASKNADFIALNTLQDEGAGFGHDTNKITLIGKGNYKKEFPLQSKKQIAESIVDCILEK